MGAHHAGKGSLASARAERKFAAKGKHVGWGKTAIGSNGLKPGHRTRHGIVQRHS
jgi:hypothetical protein